MKKNNMSTEDAEIPRKKAKVDGATEEDNNKDQSKQNEFVYSGQVGEKIPRDVTHVEVHSSVKVIPEVAFAHCSRLTNVELPKGLEEIGERAFLECTSLHGIVIPPAVRRIPEEAFGHCSRLTNVELPEGLEEIGETAFFECMSLHAIVIPPAVKIGRAHV
jgi:hypothetical protein